MNVSLTDCALADFQPLRRSRQGIGGPNTPNGKQAISQNARKHGCRSKEKILPGEQREDYDALWKQWLGQYKPESEGDVAQLGQVVDNDWRLQRTERAYTAMERALYSESANPAEWPGEMLQRLQVMQRYRTTAENSLHKSVKMLEFLKSRRDAEGREDKAKQERWDQENPERAELRRKVEAEVAQFAAAKAETSRAGKVFQGQNAARTHEDAAVLEQWAEIRVEHGRTVTELIPCNAELIEFGKTMLPPPKFVCREITFLQGIPAEYDWVGVRDAALRRRGGTGMQRMTAETWLELIEREAAEGEGHLLPTPHVPELAEQGEECCCGACVARADVLRELLKPFWAK